MKLSCAPNYTRVTLVVEHCLLDPSRSRSGGIFYLRPFAVDADPRSATPNGPQSSRLTQTPTPARRGYRTWETGAAVTSTAGGSTAAIPAPTSRRCRMDYSVRVAIGGPDGVEIYADITDVGGYSTEVLDGLLDRGLRAALSGWLALPGISADEDRAA